MYISANICVFNMTYYIFQCMTYKIYMYIWANTCVFNMTNFIFQYKKGVKRIKMSKKY